MGKDQELLEAARGGQPAVVERLLQQRARRSGPLASLRRGPGANIQDSSGYTPLHHAAVNGHKDIIKLLLAADASPSVVDQNGLTPLHLAAWGGYTDIVKSLLAHNVNPVNVDLATKTKETALHFAAHFGHVEVVSQLLMRGADPYLKNDKDETPLDLAAQYGRLDTVQHLLRMRPDLVQMYRAPMSRARIFTVTPLHLASRNGQNQVVAVLLAAGVDVNIRTEEGGTALHEAALHGKEDVVRTLLDRGIDLNLQDGKGMTVQQLLRNYKAPALLKIREIIESHRPHNGFGSDCEEYWPPIPNDRSPSYGDPCGRYSSDVEQDMERLNSLQPPKTPQVNDNFINNPSSSVTIKQHSNNFVKKITSKCLGLKAKFNSAPNISNSGDSAEVELRSKPNYLTSNRTKVTNTLHIGNSKFFKILAKKKEQPIDVICNDEFDTISLDRLVTMDRLSVYNRSNRSCPGFKISLPNISENTELSSDSSESILPDHVRDGNDNVLEAYNLDLRSSLSFAKLVVPKENHNLMVINARNSLKSVDETNELYECYESASNNILNSIEHKITKSENPDEIIKPPRRSIVAHNISNTIYENVPFENRAQTPKPPARTPHKILHETSIVASLEEPIYVNLTKPDLLNLSQPLPAKRTNLPTKNHETIPSLDSCTNEVSDSPTQSSRTSTMSLDSKIDYSNFEDILLSKKSKSFRTAGHITVYAQSLNNDDSDISSETSSVLSEFNTIEDVDCSLEQEKTDGDYVIMSRTLPKVTANDTSDTKRGLFRNVTFSNASPSLNKPDRKCTKSHLVNYHIRGTGHCIYKAPTVQEFIYVFNRDTLTQDDVHPFSKVPNNRDSYFETAICFCKPNELKHHKSADDLLAIPSDDNGPNVYIDTESLFKRVAIEASSFRCYCDDGSCSLHHKKHQSSSFAVKFHAFNRSVSTPDLLAAKVDPVLTAKATHLEEPYAVVDLSGIRFRQTYSTSSDDTSLTFGALSEPSTLSSTLRRPNSSDFQSESNSVSSDGTLRSEVGTLGVASLDGGSRAGRGCVRSGSDSRVRRWDEGDVLSEADALSVSSAASSSAPHHLMHRHHHRHHHHGYNKVSPTPPKKPPRRNLSVSPTHPNSPAASYDQLRTHARSQDDLDDLQGAKHYLKHGRSIDQYVDGKHSYPEYSEESQNSPRIIPIPNPRPSLKNRNQPVAITAMYENVVIKEQNPRRKLRRNFTHQYENFDPAKMATRRYSTQERSSLESLLDDVRSVNSPSDCERYCDGVKVPLSPTHYDQPPTPEHPPPSAKQAEKSIHERIRPLSQVSS